MTDFDAWARLSALLLRRNALECARLVRDAGVDHEWRRADAHWYRQPVEDAGAGRTDRIDRYRLFCVESLGARRRNGDTVCSPLDGLRSVSHGDAERAVASAWTVEDYAWLCAELERFPDRADDVWGARRLTAEAARRAIRDAWAERLDADPDLRSRYQELLTAYRGVLQQR